MNNENISSEWLSNNIYIKKLNEMKNIDNNFMKNLKDELDNLDFIRNHVGGHGTNSPQRGVCVMGNCDLDRSNIVKETYWTLTQKKNNVTLCSRTQEMPKYLFMLAKILLKSLKNKFPDTPLSLSSFSLFVGNEYIPGKYDRICEHTDDQPWYASPPVFASLTYFPDGEPDNINSTFRFQIRDKTDNKIKDLYLPDMSICLMRADIMHRVLPPLKKYKNHKRRINLTFRNIVSRKINPLGYRLAFANHYRYYGIPIKILCPENVSIDNKIINKYKEINKEIKIIEVDNCEIRRMSKKRNLEILESKYPTKFPRIMSKKSNVVLEEIIETLELL